MHCSAVGEGWGKGALQFCRKGWEQGALQCCRGGACFSVIDKVHASVL